MSKTDLTPLFRPRSVALVGASDKNPWCGLVLRGLTATGFSGPIHLVNKSGNKALGRDTFTSCAAIGEQVDAAFIAVPASGLEDSLADLKAGGIKFGVVVTSGFAELGEEGAKAQEHIFNKARDMGLILLGPNSLGFLNFVDGVALSPVPLPQPAITGGSIGLISQSGATTSALLDYAARQGIGFSYAVALGNEAVVDLAQIIDFLMEDPNTRAVALYAESIRDAGTFISAAERALAAAKPIVVLKVGAGELAAEVAQAHTGALVGDDKVFDAICRRYGVIRVQSLEQLVLTADLLTFTGVMDPRGIAAVSMSGGACGMIADMADHARVPFAKLSPATIQTIKTSVLPPYGTANNPLDITGAAMADASIFTRAIAALDADPDVGLILCLQEPPASEEKLHPVSRGSISAIGAGFGAAGTTCLLIGQTAQPVSQFTREFTRELGIRYSSNSMVEAIKSIAAGRAWSDRVRAYRGRVATALPEPAATRPVGERQALDYLASRGIPVIPAKIATSAAEAADFAASQSGALALKILSPDITHKTEAGGVILNVTGPEAARTAYETILANVRKYKPDSRIEGVLVSPMRERQVEFFVGIARDPLWGPVLACGLGGVWVELLADVALSVLPVTPQDVLESLNNLKSGKLLDGYRGAPPVDRAALAHIIAEIGNAALALGPDLVSLEINPLNIGPAGIEALDALTVWV